MILQKKKPLKRFFLGFSFSRYIKDYIKLGRRVPRIFLLKNNGGTNA
jgi:GTP-dependent phosphoenolpyruvate carboxykinase